MTRRIKRQIVKRMALRVEEQTFFRWLYAGLERLVEARARGQK